MPSVSDFESPNNAIARGVMGMSRERHSRHRNAHTHILFECPSKCVPTGNADQRWCSLSAGLPIGFATAKLYAARLEQIRPRTQRLTLLEVQLLKSAFSSCPPFC